MYACILVSGTMKATVFIYVAYMSTVVFVVYDHCVVWIEQMDCELLVIER